MYITLTLYALIFQMLLLASLGLPTTLFVLAATLDTPIEVSTTGHTKTCNRFNYLTTRAFSAMIVHIWDETTSPDG